jgi:hypothetical protein
MPRTSFLQDTRRVCQLELQQVTGVPLPLDEVARRNIKSRLYATLHIICVRVVNSLTPPLLPFFPSPHGVEESTLSVGCV